MITLNKEVKDLVDKFNVMIAGSQNIAIFTRDIILQREELEVLNSFIETAFQLKSKNINRYSETELNLILCLIYSTNAIKSELQMLISLKEGSMDRAWNFLVKAQYQTEIVSKNHPFSDGGYLEGYLSKLFAYERTLFPQMMFGSTGGIIKKTRCSICNDDYEECQHQKGKMYHGELCVREILEIQLEEVSIVKDPANKLCRILTIESDGKTVDVLTLKEKYRDDH